MANLSTVEPAASDLPAAMLSGDNATFLDDKYRQWLDDPTAVASEWHDLFRHWDRPTEGATERIGVSPAPTTGSLFAGGASQGGIGSEDAAKVARLVNTYRVRGHMNAEVDPLGRRETVEHPELTLGYYGLSAADLDRVFPTAPLFGMGDHAPLRDILARCRAAYAQRIGAEFMNVNDLRQKLWVAEQLERLPSHDVLDRTEELRILRKLSDAENFERLLHTRFPGTKRFSLEGGETLIPLMDLILNHAGRVGVRSLVIGMAHRGRLNVLSNVLEKPFAVIVEEFEDTQGASQGSGDVKYHLGYAAEVDTVSGDHLHLSLCFNPSHLEAVDPVVQGRVRAKQERLGDLAHETVLPILIHGDAAFAGQGLVTETLNLSELHGYRTGGTIHVIVNNQIGFTTAPTDARSGPYATDVARMLAVPIFHVNGEDPRAVAAAVSIAVAWRQRYHRDVVIDMYCYRKYGHNEGDEPSFTQPLMYEQIRSRPTPRSNYAAQLKTRGYLTDADDSAILAQSLAAFQAQMSDRATDPPSGARSEGRLTKGLRPLTLAELAKTNAATNPGRHEDTASEYKSLWARHLAGSVHEETDTTFDKARLVDLIVRANTLPDGFTAHAKIKRLLAQRRAIAHGERAVDWAVGEQAAFATLVVHGVPVRLSGQDSGRGTFSHRHAGLTDVAKGGDHYPLAHLSPDQAAFDAIDSSLSEAAVLGFEFGYSLNHPDSLVIWEAQFGDFANGAQVIIDQFITSSETKWARLSGCVMLLPHGYEGQGPEHSSARLERYLQACAEDNLQVANCTTPANFFHLLRRQALRRVRKPLVVMAPKSLLRHPRAVSTIDELAHGAFQRVIDDPTVRPNNVNRVVLCSGKIYYELLDARERAERTDVALVRVELLYPYPEDRIDAVRARYPGAELIWCQEEPRNMGAWPSYLHWFMDHLGPQAIPRFAGRPAAASPAAGSHKVHVAQQTALIMDALG